MNTIKAINYIDVISDLLSQKRICIIAANQKTVRDIHTKLRFTFLQSMKEAEYPLKSTWTVNRAEYGSGSIVYFTDGMELMNCRGYNFDVIYEDWYYVKLSKRQHIREEALLGYL